jgi:DNA polymerase III alpha subunit
MQIKKIIGVKYLGKQKSIDFEVKDKNHNFIADGVVVSNSHSVSYSYLSALTLFFKYKYPQHFYCECLKMAESKSDSQSHVAAIQQELHHFDIELLPPDLILSKPSFSIEGRNIRYGFSCIKGVSEKSLDSLQTFLDSKKTNKFEVFAAAQQAKLNVGILCTLIQSGMLSSVSKDREKTVLEAQVWKLLTEKEQTFCLKAGAEYNFDLSKMVQNITSWVGDNGKPVTRATRLETIRSKAEKYKEIYKQNKSYPEFASWYYETHLLGYSWSTSLKKIFKPVAQYIETIEEVANKKDNSSFEGVYQIAEVKTGISAKGNKWMKVKIQDETGAFYGMLIGDNYVNYLQQEIAPKEKDVVHVKGRKGADILWIDKMKIQTNKVFIKLSDIK